MPLKMNVDFFLVRPPAGNDLQRVLEEIGNRRLANREFEIRDGQLVRLEQVYSGWQRCVEGDIARLRLTELPEKGARGRKLEPLGLPPEAGVGESCAFLFDTRSQVLLLERNRYAIGSTGLASYLNSQMQLEYRIEFAPVITREAYQKLVNAPDVRRFEVGIATPRNIGDLMQGAGAVSPILAAREALHAPVAQFVFSTGPRGEGLPRRSVLRMVQDLLRMREADERSVRKIRVVARENHEEPEVLDFITERLRDAEPIELGRERTLPYEQRQGALRRIWHRHRDDIRRLFAEQEGEVAAHAQM